MGGPVNAAGSRGLQVFGCSWYPGGFGLAMAGRRVALASFSRDAGPAGCDVRMRRRRSEVLWDSARCSLGNGRMRREGPWGPLRRFDFYYLI